MRFPLKRFYQDERQTLGTLTVGEVTLFTIERPWLQNQPNVSCIPPGDYGMKLVEAGDKTRIRLSGGCIPAERSLINIEIANHANELEGCIGVGEGVSMSRWVPDCLFMVTESRAAYDVLFLRLQRLAETGVVCTLQLSDPWNL